jgi:hypothetical protein
MPLRKIRARLFQRLLLVALCFSCYLGFSCHLARGQEPDADSARALITRAGNAERETDRYQLLKQLSQLPDLDASLLADLEKILPLVDHWANGRDKHWKPNLTDRSAENGYLCDFLITFLQQKDVEHQIDKQSALYPIWLHLTAELYHFGENPRAMGADFYFLDPGDYELSLTVGEDELLRHAFTVKGRRSTIAFDLPSQRLCTIRVTAQR